MPRHIQDVGDLRLDPALLAELARERHLGRLALLDLAAGELPVPLEVCAPEALRQQHPAVALDHRRRHDPLGHRARRYTRPAVRWVILAALAVAGCGSDEPAD